MSFKNSHALEGRESISISELHYPKGHLWGSEARLWRLGWNSHGPAIRDIMQVKLLYFSPDILQFDIYRK